MIALPSKHTPGPWGYFRLREDETGYAVFQEPSRKKLIARDIHYLNAPIIAAAPEMLAALRDGLEALESSEGQTQTVKAAIETMRKAIAVATPDKNVHIKVDGV